MQRLRLIAMGLLVLATFGSLAVTGGYAVYLRSAAYRWHCAERLTAHLNLPSEIGRVVPRSRTAREFDDVRIWLPERRGEALFCRRAVVTHTPAPGDPEAYEIELSAGACEISNRTWLRSDYRAVLESGLRPGFSPDGPRRVRFGGMDLTFERDQYRCAFEDAAGVVLFEDVHRGHATVTCPQLNGHAPTEPLILRVTFSPSDGGVRIDQLELLVPRLPLAVVGLRDLIGLDVQSGQFQGDLVYGESDAGRRVTVRGKCFDLRLADFTAPFSPRPWQGECPEAELSELTLRNNVLERVHFRGALSGLNLGDALRPLGLADAGGDLKLRVEVADFSSDGIDHFVASGQCDNVSLDALSAALGWGRMSGTARLVIDDLTIRHNRLASLSAELRVPPRDNPPNWVAGALVREAVRRTLGIPLPPVLPERIEYVELGCKLHVEDEVLNVFGTHGEHGRTILTVRIAGNDIALINEPQRAYDLRAMCDELRQRATREIEPRLRALSPEKAWEALSHRRGAPASAPAGLNPATSPAAESR